MASEAVHHSSEVCGRRHMGTTHALQNVGTIGRVLSVAAGTALTAAGLRRRSLGGLALAGIGGSLIWRGISGQCSMYRALGINTAHRRGPATSIPAGHGVRVRELIIINRPAAELYGFWRDFENLGRLMSHLECVHVTGDRSHWVACGPMGTRAEWDAELITDRPNELIGWRSLPGSQVDTAGSVHFRQLPGGPTEIDVELKYDPPAGKAGAMIASLFGQSPQEQIRYDLTRLKGFMEAGHVPMATGHTR